MNNTADHMAYSGKKICYLIALACGLFGCWVIYASITSRSLYADGSYYFLRVLQAGSFTEMIAPRSYAAYLFQLPVVVAMKLGVTDLHWLSVAFGAGCLCAWPLAMWMCHRMAPTRFWLVMAACAAGYLNAAFMAVGEHIVAHAFFWPALFAVLFVRPLTPQAAAYLLASAIMLTRSYESLLFLGPPMAGLILWRMIKGGENVWRQMVLGTAAVLFGMATWIALGGVLHPVSAANFGGFKYGVFAELQSPPWTMQMTYFFGVLFLLLKLPRAEVVLRHPVGWGIIGVAVLLWGTWPLLAPGNLDPVSQYNSRFLDLLVPLALMPLAWILSIRPDFLAEKQQGLVGLSAAMLMAQSLWQISATYQWDGYIHDWQHLLTTHHGPVELAKVYRGESAEHDQALTFDWFWANPAMSVMVGPNKVQSMIMPGKKISWQPFDPLNPKSLPDLSRYGVDYTSYLDCLVKNK